MTTLRLSWDDPQLDDTDALLRRFDRIEVYGPAGQVFAVLEAPRVAQPPAQPDPTHRCPTCGQPVQTTAA